MIAPTRAASRAVPNPSFSPNSLVTTKMMIAEMIRPTMKKTAVATRDTAMFRSHRTTVGGHQLFFRGRNLSMREVRCERKPRSLIDQVLVEEVSARAETLRASTVAH